MIFSKPNKPADLTDEQLLARYRETGDSAYFKQLYERYLPLVYGVCLKYLKDQSLSQDATMDIFEQLLPKITRYDIKVFRTWLYSVVKNHCFAVLNDNKRTVPLVFDSALMETDEVLNLLVEEAEGDVHSDLMHCINLLPDVQKQAIKLFFFQKKSYADVVELTGFHLNSVKSYIQNGKRNLKICIEKRRDAQ